MEGNFIGTNSSGDAALPNSGDGLVLSDGSGNTIGGTVAAAANVISGNSGEGVDLQQESQDILQGNFIGTNVNGTSAVGNGESGVVISGGSDITLGGTTASARNVISGNTGSGVALEGDQNLVLGNFIGTDVNGTSALGNGSGVVVYSASNTIGGTARPAQHYLRE